MHPLDVRDELFGGDADSRRQCVTLLDDMSTYARTPIAVVKDETLLAWCQAEPNVRYPLVAAFVSPFARRRDLVRRWNQMTQRILLEAPNPEAVRA